MCSKCNKCNKCPRQKEPFWIFKAMLKTTYTREWIFSMLKLFFSLATMVVVEETCALF